MDLSSPRPSSAFVPSFPSFVGAVVVLVAILWGAAPTAGAAGGRTGAALLFAGGTDDLTEAQQVEIFQALGLRVSDDGKGLVDEACGQSVGPEVEFRDLDGDGVAEVVVAYGNTCMSGMAGTSIALFIRDAASHYRLNLGLPGMLAEVRSPGEQGHPDLLIGGPGFCFPVWRWNGETYVHLRNEPQSPGGCD